MRMHTASGMSVVMRAGALILAAVLATTACSTPAPATTEELRQAIAAYEHGDTKSTDDRITALFARLDAEIAALKADEAERPEGQRGDVTRRRTELEAARRDLEAEYVRARIARLGSAAHDALSAVREQLGKNLEEAGRRLREAPIDPPPADR